MKKIIAILKDTGRGQQIFILCNDLKTIDIKEKHQKTYFFGSLEYFKKYIKNKIDIKNILFYNMEVLK